MYLIVILVFLFCLLWIIAKKRDNIERFFPAWQDHQIYGKLSRRIRLGLWKGWMNINNLLLTNQLLNFTNIDVITFNSNDEAIDALLVDKNVDVVITTEADYGIYISDNFNMNSTKQNIMKNKKNILANFNTRRLYTFYSVYRILLTDNFKVNKQSDLTGKVIEITNLTNDIHKLDLDLLKNIDYIKVYRETDRGSGKYDSINKLGYNINAYFTQYDYPNPLLSQISYDKNTTIIDLFSEDNNDDTNKITHSEVILDKYFYLTKDKMKLDAYPEIKKRRRQSILYNNLPYDPNYVNCYSYKMIMLTREDVEDEWIYLFTKDIMDNIETIIKNVKYLENVTKDSMLKSSLSDILPMHRACYRGVQKVKP
jgi:TRAP-type uncharacterized transport system substrate-binding protein